MTVTSGRLKFGIDKSTLLDVVTAFVFECVTSVEWFVCTAGEEGGDGESSDIMVSINLIKKEKKKKEQKNVKISS